MESIAKGIVAYASYLPAFFLEREDVGNFLGDRSERGRRAVACFDEDTTTMGVEAARNIPVSLDGVRHLFFATSSPAYAEKTNANAIHAALHLSRSAFATDFAGSIRGSMAAMMSASEVGGLAVLSDIRVGLPGSAEERHGGDAAAAFLFGSGTDVLAELLSSASITTEFLERWRLPGDLTSRSWEERFGLELYVPLMKEAAAEALNRAGLETTDYLVVSSPHRRAAKALVTSLSWKPQTISLDEETGYMGAADAGVLLADALDRAEANQTIMVLSGSDGADAIIFRVTEAIVSARPRLSVRAQLGSRQKVDYGRYLSWRGLLRREPPRRPDPASPAGPPAARNSEWKFGLIATRCRVCGAVQAPPARVCYKCRSVDRMDPHPLAGLRGTLTAVTVDHLAYSLSPPSIGGVVDFDGGGRIECGIADAEAKKLPVGTRVTMVFRKLSTTNGVHNYFWKAKSTGESIE